MSWHIILSVSSLVTNGPNIEIAIVEIMEHTGGLEIIRFHVARAYIYIWTYN